MPTTSGPSWSTEAIELRSKVERGHRCAQLPLTIHCAPPYHHPIFSGDAYPTLATAEAAFGSAATFSLIWSTLNYTDSACPGCHNHVPLADGSYPLYWTLTVSDYYWASGNSSGFLCFVKDMAIILDKQAAEFNTTGPNIGFIGWDDRVGNGGGK
jgi:hypothetical protein